MAARHRSDSVNATSIDEQSLGHRQRLPAVGTTHQRLLQLTDLRDYGCNGAKTLHPPVYRPRTPLVFFWDEETIRPLNTDFGLKFTRSSSPFVNNSPRRAPQANRISSLGVRVPPWLRRYVLHG
jgi:hypothetical protein